MNLKASLLFARTLIFPKTQKASSARKSLSGAFLCIALSLIPLIVVVSVTNAMSNAMTERIIQLDSSHIELYVRRDLDEVQTAAEFSEYAESYAEIEGVTEAYPQITLNCLAIGKNFRTGAQVRALPADIFSRNKAFERLFKVLEGNTAGLKASENSVIFPAVIGQKMAETLKLNPGDTLRLLSSKEVNGRVVPKISSFKVCAVITSGYQELDQLWIFLPLEAAYKSFSLSNANYNILLNTKDAFSPALPAIQRRVKNEAGVDANVYRWNQLNQAKFENFSSTKVMLFVIMLMILLVAGINISSAILMLVMERRREIAILKSLGAKPSSITFAFILAGTCCGSSGLLAGIPLGILISLNANSLICLLEKIINFFIRFAAFINGQGFSTSSSGFKLLNPEYYLQQIPVEIPVSQIVLIAVFTIFLSFFMSVIPSVKAGKEKPLEYLRGTN